MKLIQKATAVRGGGAWMGQGVLFQSDRER